MPKIGEQTGVEGVGSGRAPPYIPFATFLTLLEELRLNGIPDRIDRSVLKRFSGATGTQLLSGIRSLGLVNGEDRPSETLVTMVNASDEALGPLLGEMLRSGYPYAFKIDLTTATPSMFAEAFKNNVAAKEDVLIKCRRFFLQAAKRAGIALGPRLQAGSANPRAKAPSGANRKPRTPKVKEENQGDAKQDKESGTTAATIMETLLAKFPDFDPKWPDELKAKWFADFDLFAHRALKP